MLVGFPFADSQEDIPASQIIISGATPKSGHRGWASQETTAVTTGLSRDSEPLGPALGSEKEEALFHPFQKAPRDPSLCADWFGTPPPIVSSGPEISRTGTGNTISFPACQRHSEDISQVLLTQFVA